MISAASVCLCNASPAYTGDPASSSTPGIAKAVSSGGGGALSGRSSAGAAGLRNCCAAAKKGEATDLWPRVTSHATVSELE